MLLVVCWFSGVAGAAECNISLADNCTVSSSMTLDGGHHDIADGGSNGVIIINASDMTLDCNGTTINGTGSGYGIYNDGYDNVTIKNCTVTRYEWGIYLYSSSNNTLTNNNANNNSDCGIRLDTSNNYNILTNNDVSNNNFGIRLESSENNTLTNNTANNNANGIGLLSSSDNTLTSNNASNNIYYGIDIWSSNYNNLTNNTANINTEYGIYITSSSNNNLTNNTANINTKYGIYITSSSNNNLTNNTANNNYDGIYLDTSNNYNTLTNNTANNNTDNGIYLKSSSNNTLTSNTASNSTYGIWLDSSSYNILAQNTMSNNNQGNLLVDGVTESNYNHTIDATNSVNGYPVYYNFSEQDKTIENIDNIGHLTLAYCTNFTVRNNNVSYGDGIKLISSNDSNVTNNTANNTKHCIRLSFSNNNTLKNNTVSNNQNIGIRLDSSSNNTLTNNTANNNTKHGIRLSFSSNYNILTNNYASGNSERGIFLESSSNNNLTNNTASGNSIVGIFLDTFSNYNTLTNNNASNNTFYGIYIESSSNNMLKNNTASNNNDYGICLDTFSNYNTLTNNTANNNIDGVGIAISSSSDNNMLTNNTANNNKVGIELSSSSNNTLTNNTVSDNSQYGIYLEGSSTDNLINYNNIYNNTIYNLKNVKVTDVNAAYNWWGTTNCTNISLSINDHQDDPSYGNVIVNPILSASYPGGNPIRCSLVVNQSSPACTAGISYHTTIQDAINTASAGDEIIVCADLYSESITVDKSVTLRANNTTYDVTVNSSLSSQHAINVSADYVNISWLKVQNATDSEKAGIYASGRSQLNISNNNVTSNYFGIYFSNSSSNNLTDNTANNNAYYGITLVSSSNNNTLQNNTVSDNSNGIYLADNSTDNLINYNNIYNNTMNLNNSQSTDVDATYNWWGTTNCPEISNSIYDYQNDVAYGNVSFQPFLNALHPGGSPVYCEAETTPTPNPSIGGGDPAVVATAPPVTVSVLRAEKQTMASIKAGELATISFSKVEISEITLKLKATASNVQIEVSKLGGKPTDITTDPSGTVYRYMKIETRNVNSAGIDSATIQFKVENSWIEDNNMNLATVRLSRYYGGKWNELSTTMADEDSKYTYYEAETPGFSYFVITGEPDTAKAATATATSIPVPTAPTAPTPTTTPTPTPARMDMGLMGGGIAVLIIAILVIVAVLYKEKLMEMVSKKPGKEARR